MTEWIGALIAALAFLSVLTLIAIIANRPRRAELSRKAERDAAPPTESGDE